MNLSSKSSVASGAVSQEALRHKTAGGRLFATAEYKAALESYQSALQCLPMKELVWPEHERFALTLYSNSALCLLKLNRPQEAVQQCALARSLPVFEVHAADDLRQKVLARHAEALIDCREIASGRAAKDDETVSPVVDPSKKEIWNLLDDARLRGYLSKKSGVSAQTRKKFLLLGARLYSSPSHVASEAAIGLTAWTDRLVRADVLSATKANQARLSLEEATTEEKERRALALLDSLIPKPSMTIGDLCRQIIACVRGTIPSADAVSYLRNALRDSNLHPSGLDDDGKGYLMWAISYGLFHSNYINAQSTEIFLALLSFLIDELGVSIDQRAKMDSDDNSRNPLQYVVKYGNPRAVKAMLDRGAKVNLRDEEGWTALGAICMNDIKATTCDRVETARLLLDAGADVHAESSMGFTPLLSLCSKPCPQVFAMLLARGAKTSHLTTCGMGAVFLLDQFSDKDPTATEECKELLFAHDDGTALQRKTLRFSKMVKNVLVKTCNDIRRATKSPSMSGSQGLRERATQEIGILSALFEYLEMDPNVLRISLRAEDGNWLEVLHSRVSEIVPSAYVKVYCNDAPPEVELKMMIAHSKDAFNAAEYVDDNGTRRFSIDTAKQYLLKPFRERGLHFSGAMMENFHNCVVDTTQHCVGFAVPTKTVIERIGKYGPVVEVGAGTGYWSALLQSRGIDTIAYDAHPPTEDHESSHFFNFTYTNVLKGDATKLFQNESDLSQRTLLMVWPNNADKVDNSHLYTGVVLPPVWDADCLSSYIRAGGKTVVYVGEREEKIRVLPGARSDCGVSSSRRFQKMLAQHFRLIEEHDIPQWFLCEDDATIWQRK